MHLYDSVCGYGEAEYIVEKSRFIAHVTHAESLDEAKAFCARIKGEYRDATHNVPAIIIGTKQEVQWASDDGEPAGTSGLPVLKMIAGEGLTNLAVVVTRYFGGIKLGTGGLARAYTTAGRLGLDAAGRCRVCESALIRYEFDYSCLSKLQNLSAEGKFEMEDTEYSDVVRASLRCLSEDEDEVRGIMINLTSGRAKILSEKKDLIRLKK